MPLRLRLRLRLTCQETARLVLDGEDRTLRLGERALVRMHLRCCQGCTRFSQQVRLLRGAMDGWRRGMDGQDDGPPRR